jgi:outer membrane protein assembly factor BamA
MNRITVLTAPVLGALAACLAAAPALAQPYTLDKVEINGLQSADPSALRAQLKDQPGAKVTTSDIIGDQDQLEKLLEAQHIGGAIKTSLRNKHNGHVDVIFDVADKGVVKPVVTTVAPKLKQEIFIGNAKLTNDDLQAASGLKPGDELSNEKIQAAQLAIQAAYKKANVGCEIAGAVSQNGGDTTITWTIKETKVKKKRKNTEDPGQSYDPG